MPDSHPCTYPICSPSQAPSQACLGEDTTKPAFPKSEASTPRHPHFVQRVSCGVYVTVCPLACKQKAQPRRRGAPGTAREPQRCARTSPGLCRWGLSSRCPPPLVASGSCGSKAARRGFAGANPAAFLPAPPHPLQPPAASCLRPGSPRQARSRRPGARGRRATAELGGGGNGRLGAARPASPLGKSSSSLLLAKANTALFFPDRANAPGTRAATRRAPAECSASSGKARGVQSRPWANSQGSSAHRGRPEAGRVPAWPQRPRTLPPPPPGCSKDGQPGNPESPLAAEDVVGQADCGLPAPTRRGSASKRPPRGRAG